MSETTQFIERKRGGWLGLYNGDGGLRIGVTGKTEGHAKMLLEHSIGRWRAILSLRRAPEPPALSEERIPERK